MADAQLIDPPASFKSPVWKHFAISNNKETTVCRKCLATFKYSTGSTSSMSAHLKRKHQIDVQSESKLTKVPMSSATSGGLKTEPLSGTGQLSLPNAFRMTQKLPRSSTRYGDITYAIGVFIAKDLRPYSVVQNSGWVTITD